MNTINSVNFNSKNNYNNPSFSSIQSIKCSGLYKKYPEYAKKLVDSFMANDEAMTFCKKYDVDLVFSTHRSSYNSVCSDFVMYVDNISKGKFRKFLDSLNSKKDKIHLTGFSNSSDTKGIDFATSNLTNYFSDESGVLNSHMQSMDRKIQTDLAKKSAKKQAKIDLANKRKALTEEKAINEKNLKSAVDDLIRKSKSQD